MPDGLLQLASTIFLTFGLGTLLYALVAYFLKQLVGGEEPRSQARPAPPRSYPAGPAVPQAPAYYGQAYGTGYPQPGTPQPPAPASQSLPGFAPPPGYPMGGPWAPPGSAPRG